MIRFARTAVIGVAAAATLVAPAALATVQYVDPITHLPVTPGQYDFSLQQPPCFLDDTALQVTDLSLQNAQLMVNNPSNFVGIPWCDPLKGVFFESSWDQNNNGTIDSLEDNTVVGTDSTPTPSPSNHPSPTPSPSTTPDPTPTPSNSPSVLGAQTDRITTPTPSPSSSPSATPSASPSPKGSVLGASVLPGVGTFGNLLTLGVTGSLALIAAVFYKRHSRKQSQ